MYELPFLAFGRVPLYQLLPVVEAGADPAVGKGGAQTGWLQRADSLVAVFL